MAIETSYSKLLSFSKINLVLSVGAKRSDGFHHIESLMAKLRWGDEIQLKLRQSSETKIKIQCRELRLPLKKNLMYQAAHLFSERLPVFFDMDVILKKNIPTEAGLAGGSSNAATVLSVLRKWYLSKIGKYHRLDSVVFKIAADLGSDVPFFLKEEKSCWCSGRGEKCEAVSLPKMPVVLVFPKTKISTAWAYQELDKLRKSKTKARPHLIKKPEYLKRRDYQIPIFQNDFEELALRRYRELRQLKRDLAESGAATGGMTGSGSCFYGIYQSPQLADKGKIFLKSRSWKTAQSFVGEL